MELLELQTLLSKPEELIKKIQSTKSSDSILTYQKQYDSKKHDITDNTKRPDKTVETDSGTSLVTVARLPIPLQKQIVLLAAAFLCGNPVQFIAAPVGETEKDFLAVLKRAWKDNKLDYESKRLAKLMMSETEVAEIWYTEASELGYWKGTVNDSPSVKSRLRVKIAANKYGDKLYPVFSNSGDMIAFGRWYSVKNGDKVEEHFDLYTDTTTYIMVKGDAGWTSTPAKNETGKIPVIYYNQEFPEWHDVQEMIDRLEKLISNHADTNDYNGSPIIKVSGKIAGFSKKGEAGKIIEMENGADASYLSWDSAPESIKLEYQTLRSLIFDMTNTPDISFENMKSLGVFSGIALKMLFLGAHLKASDKEEIFGKSIQRRINFMKRALANINVTFEKVEPLLIEPKFEYYLPKNNEELINMLSTATGAKPTMSQKTAVAQNPFVQDPVTELETIAQEGLNAEVDTPL